MNLLCPNCQKMLTVPEEFAGQLMKCPLCTGTFTVPALPAAAPPPPAVPEPDIFSVRAEPSPPTPPPSQDLSSLPPAPATTTTPAPPSRAPLPPEGYQRALVLWISPKVLPWIAPVCLVFVFFLQFFNWVGLYPGGVPVVTQNAWQAAFGFFTEDGDLKERWGIKEDKDKPGVSFLTLFYLLLFFPVLLATIASVVLGLIPVKLPPGVEKILPWRWGIVAAANLILFFFLALQTVLGFSLDSRYTDLVDRRLKDDSKEAMPTKDKKMQEVARGRDMGYLRHAVWLRLVVLLHIVAIVSAALMFWMAQRGTHRPLPKIELMW